MELSEVKKKKKVFTAYHENEGKKEIRVCHIFVGVFAVEFIVTRELASTCPAWGGPGPVIQTFPLGGPLPFRCVQIVHC